MLKGISSRDEVLTCHRQMLAEFGFQPYNLSLIVQQIDTESSLLPLVELTQENRISLSDIEAIQDIERKPKLGESRIVTGKWLLCRSMAPVTRNLVGIVGLAVDDYEGRLGAQLALHNVPVMLPSGSNFPVPSTQDKIPVGTLIALMNPTLRCMNGKTGNMSLYCQNPAHIVFLGKEHKLLENVNFKAELPYKSEVANYDELERNKAGVQYHLLKNYTMAIECFTLAIEQNEGDLRIAYGNRSAAYLAHGMAGKALEDAEKGLQIDSDYPKLWLRKAKALFHLKRFRECIKFIDDHQLKEAPSSLPDYEFTRKIAHTAFEESEHGKYDFEALKREARFGKSPYLEHHTEYWPDELLDVHSDREIFAKADIVPGTLLASGKALVFNPSSGRDNSRGYELCTMLAARAAVEPEVCNSKLAKFAPSPDRMPNFDGSKDDIQKVLQLIRCNTFVVTKADLGSELQPLGSGIWPLAAMISNSCVDATCHVSYIGTLCFVRAIKHIKKGDQLTLCRFPPSIAGFERRAEQFSFQGFTCQCRLCSLERKEDEHVKSKMSELAKKYLNVDLAAKVGQPGFDKGAAEKLASVELPEAIKQAEELRKPRELNMNLQQLKLSLARLKGRMGDLEGAVALLEEVAQDYGKASLFNEEAMCAQWINDICSQLGQSGKAKKWFEREKEISKFGV